MSDNSAIEWTDASWNPIRARNRATGKIGWHCEHATTGCEFCYAEGFNKRLGTGLPFKPGHRKDIEIFLDEKMLLAPLRWKRPRKIFVGSMTDLFADFVTDEWLDKIFAVMALCPQHVFQVLTKRAERLRAYFDGPEWMTRYHSVYFAVQQLIYDIDGDQADRVITRALDAMQNRWPLPNVWLGVSCERQEEADERIPHLLATPAAVRFISAEPLLGAISFRWAKWDNWCDSDGSRRNTVNDHDGLRMLDWIIVGGESGPNARPMNPQWARDIRDECRAAGVAFFHKQNGEFASVSQVEGPGAHHRFPDGRTVRCVGKKAAGRLLDGREHNDFPVTETGSNFNQGEK